MADADDVRRLARGPAYPGRVSEDSEDLVQAGGGRRSRIPNWQPSRGAALLGALGLVAGLAAGYAAGDRHAASGAQPRRPQATASRPLSIGSASLALTQATSACSTQVGRDLQLGVQVTNRSGAPVTLRRVQAVLPFGGLKAVAQQWAPCGIVHDAVQAQDQTGGSLAPGASAWFTVTFEVLLKCPRPLPVQFTLDYDVQGVPATASLPGFPDLTQVPYTGCAAS